MYVASAVVVSSACTAIFWMRGDLRAVVKPLDTTYSSTVSTVLRTTLAKGMTARSLLLLLTTASALRDCTLSDTRDGDSWTLDNCSKLTLGPERALLSVADVTGLSGALSGCHHVHCPTVLELLSVPLNYEGGRQLSIALANGTRLKGLDLRWNSLHREGTRRLAEALGENATALDSLTLESNGIGDPGAAALADYMLASNGTLRSLGLASNFIGDAGAVALAAVLRANTTLESVDLRHNAITHQGLTALAEAIEASRGLGVLKVQGNPAAANAELLERLRSAVARLE